MFLQGKLVTVLSSKHYVFLYHNTLRHILVSANLSDNRRDNLKFCNSVHLSRFFLKDVLIRFLNKIIKMISVNLSL
jgi:hypothetical protein